MHIIHIYSMNDEACVHYVSTIDNMSVGHRFIAETFGPEYVPKIGWQVIHKNENINICYINLLFFIL